MPVFALPYRSDFDQPIQSLAVSATTLRQESGTAEQQSVKRPRQSPLPKLPLARNLFSHGR